MKGWCPLPINISPLKAIAERYGLTAELPELDDPEFTGRVLVLSGPTLPSPGMIDEVKKELFTACPDLKRITIEIPPKGDRSKK